MWGIYMSTFLLSHYYYCESVCLHLCVISDVRMLEKSLKMEVISLREKNIPLLRLFTKKT